MALQFLNFYVSNMEVLCSEMFRNQRSIQHLSDNIKSLISEVQQKFKQFVADMMKKQRLQGDDEVDRNSQIKVIYLLIRQIQKCETEKRSLTREACDILDKYLATLGRNVETAQTRHLNGDDHGPELLKTLSSIKNELDQPMQGNAAIIDLIKKMENERAQNATEPNVMVFDDVNKNVEVKFSAAGEMTKQVSDLIYRTENLQAFTEKVVHICSEMRNRYGSDELSNSDSDALTNNDEGEDTSSTEEDYELCHCRTQEFGQMVACDNTKCKIRWYHFECVGLYKSPVGLWFCPSCIIFENV